MATTAAASPPAIATALSALLRRQRRRSSRCVGASHARCLAADANAEAVAPSRRGGHGGTRLEEAVPAGEGRSRIDAWISARLGGGGVSRARIQASIRAGLVVVNGRPVSKVTRFPRNLICFQLSFHLSISSTISDVLSKLQFIVANLLS